MSFRHLLANFHPVALGLLLVLGSLAFRARPLSHYALEGHEQPVALLQTGQSTYLVTQHSVFRLEGPRFVRQYHGAGVIQGAAVADTVLWLGTRQGLWRLNTRTFRAHPAALPVPEATPPIAAVFVDARGDVWAGISGYGVFRQHNGTFVSELTIPSVNAGVALADSSVWIGTSIGLHRKLGPDWTRYNEEGVANHEIPDNIVEKLLPDHAGNLWVIMSEGVCVMEHPSRRPAMAAEWPAVKFLGRPGNEVYAVATVPGEGRLFATAMGVLVLPEAATPSGPNASAAPDKIEDKPLLVSLPPLPGSAPGGSTTPHLLEVDAQRRVWLVSADEVTVLTARQLQAWLRSARPKSAARGLPG